MKYDAKLMLYELMLAAMIAGTWLGASCRLNVEPDTVFHVVPDGPVIIESDTCVEPCCTHDFDSGEPASHEGCK